MCTLKKDIKVEFNERLIIYTLSARQYLESSYKCLY